MYYHTFNFVLYEGNVSNIFSARQEKWKYDMIFNGKNIILYKYSVTLISYKYEEI